MSSAPVAGAAFERYHQQRGGGGAAAAANSSTVRSAAVPCVCVCVPGVGRGFGAVLVSDADGRLPPRSACLARVGGR
jgi:hypothetical protein